MTTLWKDPRTGILILRKRVPQRYRSVAGIKGETIKLTTGTADRKAAMEKLPDVCRQWADLVAKWERLLNAEPLGNREAHALAGLWYRRKIAEWEANPEAVRDWDNWDVAMPTDPYVEGTEHDDEPVESKQWRREWDRFVWQTFGSEVDELLASQGVGTDEASKVKLAELLCERLPQALERHWQTRRGDYSPDPLPATMPPWEGPQSPAPPRSGPPAGAPSVSLDALLDAWKAVAVVKPRTVTETQYTVTALCAFVGHSDAARITRDDLQRWRDTAKRDGLTNNAWNNRLSMMRQVFARGVADGLITINPADNTLRLRKNKPEQQRLPYSDDEAVRILTAARKETRPALRWAHWVMAFTGMRVAEVLQLTGGDVRQDGGIWFLAVHEDDAGKSVKTGQPRNVPVHSALVREGFIAYAKTIPPDAPVFPDKRLDKHGQRGGRGWNAVGKWVREVVGITDRQKAPNHSWRHRLEDEMRAAEVQEDARDAITGHARKTTGRLYGVRGEALARLQRQLERVPVPPGLWDNTPT